VRSIVTRVLIISVLAAFVFAGGLLAGGEPRDRMGAARTATVTRIVDGDTVVLSGVGKSRLIGIDTPEVYGSTECFGPEASAFARRLLAGRRVRWEPGVETRDRYGRALVYLWLADGRFVNELLVAGGYARTLAIAPNTRFAARLRVSAGQARDRGAGLWAATACSGRVAD
jgi:micrococcal nuclease